MRLRSSEGEGDSAAGEAGTGAGVALSFGWFRGLDALGLFAAFPSECPLAEAGDSLVGGTMGFGISVSNGFSPIVLRFAISSSLSVAVIGAVLGLFAYAGS